MSVDSSFDYERHLRRVCYYTLALVVVLACITVLAWSARSEANFAAARASSFWAFYNAKSMQDLRLRLEIKGAAPGGMASMPNATASGLPAASPSGAPAAAPSAAPAAARASAEQARALSILDRDQNDAREMALHFEKEAEADKSDVEMFSAAQIGLLIAICLCALGGPTKRIEWCNVALVMTLVCVGVAAYAYLT